MRNTSGRAIASRRLALERLESRDVPAPLVEVVELPTGISTNRYDIAAEPTGTLLMAGVYLFNGQIVRLNDRGQTVATIELAPAAGRPDVAVYNLSEDGRWAVGFSYFSFVSGVDPAPNRQPVVTLWRLDEPDAPIALDFLDSNLQPSDLDDLSNVGTFAVTTAEGKLLLVGPGGVEELALPAGTPTDPAINGRNRVADVSRDGSLLIGATLAPLPAEPLPIRETARFRATLWRDRAAELLEMTAETTSSMATSLSDDERVIGGSIFLGDTGNLAVVWIDGRLKMLSTAAGQNMRGIVSHVVSGIGGDPTKWLAFGRSYQAGFPDATFVARSDGIAVPLSDWLRTDYAFEASLESTVLTDVVLADGWLRLFSTEYGFVPPNFDDPSIGAPAFLERTGTKMFTVNLTGNEMTTEEILHDVNVDGRVNALDVLAVVNAITVHGTGTSVAAIQVGERAVDVNEDELLSLLDVLTIVNYLTRQNATGSENPHDVDPEGEGHDITQNGSPAAPAAMQLAIDQICEELATRRRRR